MKITTNSYNEYDDKNAIIEALDLNINNLIVKSNSLIEGSVKVKNSFKVKGQKLSNIVERISLIEKEIKNLSTIVAYYQNVNITEGNKEDYKTTNDDYSKLYHEFNLQASENRHLSETNEELENKLWEQNELIKTQKYKLDEISLDYKMKNKENHELNSKINQMSDEIDKLNKIIIENQIKEKLLENKFATFEQLSNSSIKKDEEIEIERKRNMTIYNHQS